MVAGLTLLLDADVNAYVAATVHQKVTDWGDGAVSVVTDPLADALATLRDGVEEVKKHLGAKRVIYCLSDDKNFRKEILPTYKGNRRVKPVLLPQIRDWIKQNTNCYVRPKLEGDDVMGILATHPTLVKGEKVIVSIDKDMKSIPGTVYNPRKDDFQKVSVEEADHFHLMQTLTGDPVDNYKGCPGVGPVKARAILWEGAGSLWASPWERIVAEYRSKSLTEADALVQARVARILRHTDYDFKRKEPRLWQPSR